jgi:hypothetical protein
MVREPTEMSRPATTNRAGVRPIISPAELSYVNIIIVSFTESQGVGVHILMSANKCPSAWSPNSWYSLFHLHVNVSPHMPLRSSVTDCY